MEVNAFSKKQQQVLCWWHPKSSFASYDALICDGAVRSGKTFCLSLSFIFWSFANFSNKQFAFCGKTIRALHRNVVTPLLPWLESLGFQCQLSLSQNLLTISYEEQENYYYLFGGKDEGSASHIQGITLAGVLFDEVALMPRSFVEQALARCSVDSARFWFNCNPESPSHWFYKEWICQPHKKNALYLHFTMEDNPSLSATVRKRYESLYQGVFYQRYIAGQWTQVQGAVYPMFSKEKHIVDELPKSYSRYVVSCDYGTMNPTSMGLWGYAEEEDCWYRLREYYHDARSTGVIKTDEESVDALETLVGNLPVETVVVDPSAASFIQCIHRRERFSVTPATNDILNGIRLVSDLLMQKKLKFHQSCQDSIKEFQLYHWKENAEKDTPVQKHDHAMDDIRYFAQYVFRPKNTMFYALSSDRN